AATPVAAAITPANQVAALVVAMGPPNPARRRIHAAESYTAARYMDVSINSRHGGGPTSVRSSPVKIARAATGAQPTPRASSSAMRTPVLGFQGVILVCGSGST